MLSMIKKCQKYTKKHDLCCITYKYMIQVCGIMCNFTPKLITYSKQSTK